LLLIVSGTSEITIDEIGEINDHIQTEAGFNANIIMGVGEDESLGDDIAVTIIATGFNIEQQNDIVNTEPKKIIHTLGTEQKLVQDLSSNKEIPSFDFSTFETTTATKEEKIVFELIEDEVEFDIVAEAPAEVLETPIVETPTFTMDLVPTSEFLKNLEVTFEIVAPELDQEYYFSAPEVNEIEVNSIQPIFEQEEQITFSFDLPIAKTETPTSNSEDVLFQLTEETKNIFVNEPVQFVPMTELNESGIVKYSLEEYMDVENKLANSKPIAAVVEEPVEELNITVKEVEMTSNLNPFAEEISPMEMTLEESARIIADERRRKLKEFNYKFHNNPSKVDEYEKEPAYKRSGIDLSTPQQNNSNSRMSFGIDSNNDNQLRTNNSFLHDNVD
jgi:cell division protein FtsZ